MSTRLGTRIKELRMIADMSQEELGRRVGVQRAAIQKYEKGTVENVPIKTIENIAKVFNVSPTYLVGWTEEVYNELSMEVKILAGIKLFYGKDAVDLLESYLSVPPVAKKKIQQYANDIYQLHNKE